MGARALPLARALGVQLSCQFSKPAAPSAMTHVPGLLVLFTATKERQLSFSELYESFPLACSQMSCACNVQ